MPFIADAPDESNIIVDILALFKQVVQIGEIIAIDHITKGDQMLRHVSPCRLSRGSAHNLGAGTEIMQTVTIILNRVGGIFLDEGLHNC